MRMPIRPRPERCGKRREPEVAGMKVELLVASRLRAAGAIHERDACLAVLADEVAVGAQHGGGVVEETGARPPEDRVDEDDGRLPREPRHSLDRRPRDRLRPVEVLSARLDAEIHRAEELRQTDDLRAPACRLAAEAPGGLDVDLPVDMAPNWTLAILFMGSLS